MEADTSNPENNDDPDKVEQGRQPEKKIRKNFELTKSDHALLLENHGLDRGASLIDTIRKALRLQNKVLKAMQDGTEIIFRTPDGKEARVIIL